MLLEGPVPNERTNKEGYWAAMFDHNIFQDSALSEISRSAGVGMMLDEAAIPVTEEVQGLRDPRPRSSLCRERRQAPGNRLARRDRYGPAAMKSHPLASEPSVIGEVPPSIRASC